MSDAVPGEPSDVLVVALGGEIDIANVAEIEAAANDAVSSRQRCLVFDLSKVTFIDATGVGALLRSRRALRSVNAELRLRSPAPPVLRLLQLAAVESELPIED